MLLLLQAQAQEHAPLIQQQIGLVTVAEVGYPHPAEVNYCPLAYPTVEGV